MIKCALSTETVEKLYKSIYAHMVNAAKNEEPFDAKKYIQYVFENKAAKSNQETAAKLVQHIPRIIIDIDNVDFFDKEDFLDIAAVKKLGQRYLNSRYGISNVIKDFTANADGNMFKALAETKGEQAFQTESEDPEPDRFDIRLQPFNAFSGTFQEFITIDPKKKEILYDEQIDESKKVIYGTLKAIKNSLPNDITMMSTVVYKGKEIKIKATPLSTIPRSELDTYTQNLIAKSRSIEKEGKGVAGVTPADQIVALLITDGAGKPLFFNEEGEYTDKADGGKIVYQFLRDARKEGDNYTVKNIYGYEDQILSPEDIAGTIYNPSFDNMPFTDFVELVRQKQQEDFKRLYEFKEDVLKNNKQILLPLLNISKGVKDSLVGSTIMLNNLDTLVDTVDRSTYKTIKTVQKSRGIYQKGYATIMINDSEFVIDRADATDEVARQVAQVLTNKDIDFSERVDFYSQFFSNNLQQTTRRHETAGDYSKKQFWFNYSNDTSQERPQRNFLDNSINLSEEALLNKTAEQLKADEEAIYNVLMTGKGKKNRYPAKMMFNSNLLKTERYQVYDAQEKEIKFADYINFVKTLKTPIQIFSGDPGVYNTYMVFDLPSDILTKVDKAKAEVKENKTSENKKTKDEVVNMLKSSGVIDVDVVDQKSGFAYGKHYANFTVSIPELNKNAKIYFHNKTKLVTINGKIFEDPTWPKLNESVRLQLNDQLVTEDGLVLNNVVEVFNINQDGTTGSYIGVMAETDFTKTKEQPRTPEEVEDQTDTSDIVENVEPEIESIAAAEPITPTSTNTAVSNLLNKKYKGLDRSFPLDGKVTAGEIADAISWWHKSPLNKYIRLEHAANLVNSDVYARFVVAGATLLDWSRKGKIIITEKGSFVDAYHEAWHAFTQLYWSPQKKVDFYNSVRDYKNAKGEKPYAKKSYFEIEEMLAEDFRTYAKNPKTYIEKVPRQRTLFQELLNFLYHLFTGGPRKLYTEVTKDVVVGNYPAEVDQMFKKLYFASKNPKLLNEYTPKISNVMWDILNRGVERVDNKREDALNKQDSNLMTATIDSLISETIDEMHDARLEAGKASVKSGTTKMISDQEFVDEETGAKFSNRDITYGVVKEKLEEKLKYFKSKLGEITTKPFNSFDTLKKLSDNAIAVIKSEKGEDKYVFLSSQVDNFDKLNPEIKRGERIKGEKYKEDVSIVADFYSHKDIKSANNNNVEILIVNDPRDAQIQFDAFVRGGEKDFTALEINEAPEYKELTNEQEKLVDNIRILSIALNNWGDNKSGMIKYHMDNSRFDIIRQKYVDVDVNDMYDAEGNPIDNTDASEAPKDSADQWDKSVGKKSSDQFAGKETLYIVKSLFKKNKQNEFVYNKLGVKELADFSRTWSILLREIGGVKDREEAYNKLKIAANDYAPELKQLIDKKLPDPSKINNEAEFNISSSFWQDFSISNIPYNQLTIFPVKNDAGNVEDFTTEVTDASIEPSNVLRKFQALYKSSTEEDNPYITNVNNLTMLTDLSSIVSTFEDKKNKGNLDVKKALPFAHALGIYLDDIDVIKKELRTNSEYYGLPYIYDIVKDLAEIKENPQKSSKEALEVLKKFQLDPIATLRGTIPEKIIKSLKGKEVNQSNIMNRLAELQIKFGLETSNAGVMNAAGDIVYTYVQDFSISRKVDALNNVENLTDCWTTNEDGNPVDARYKYMSYLDPKRNSFTLRSQILKSVFNFESGEFDRRGDKKLDLFMDSGTQVAEISEGTNTIDLDISGKFLQEMHTMLKGGVQEFIRAASKKTSLGVKVSGGLIKDTGLDAKLYVDVDAFVPGGKGELYAASKIITPYIAAEYDRIQKFKDNKDEFLKYTGYNRRVGGTEKNPVYAGEVFTAFDNVLTEKTKNDLLSPDTLAKVKAMGGDLVKYLKTDSDLRGRIEQDIMSYFEEQTNDNINFLADNKFIDKSLFEKIGDTDLIEEEQEKVLVKAYTYNSWIHNFETVNLFIGEMGQFNHLKEELHKRNTGSQSGGRKFLTDQGAQDFINNIWNKKSYASKLNSKYNKFFYDGTINTGVISDVIRESIYMSDIEKGLREDYVKSLKKFGKSDEEIEKIIDARLKKELKAYREMTEPDAAGYITFDAYRTLRKLENNWSDRQEALFQQIANGKPVLNADVEEYFPEYKLQNYGELANQTLVPITAMHKFALSPLIPSVIKGTELEHLHMEMMRNNIQYVTFESGSKVGNVTSDGKPDQIFTDDTHKKLKDELTFTPNTVYLEYVKNITEVNTSFKSKITFPTQMRGLILDGLYEEGDIADAKNADTAKNYLDSVSNFTEVLKMELLNEIDYEKKDGKYIGNLGKFLDLVQKELSKRDVPEHLIKFIGVNDDNTLKTDLSLHLEADSIEKILLSIINKRLINQKIKGEALVQVPATMYNGLWDKMVNLKVTNKEEEKKYIGSNNLPFYTRNADGTSNPMKVAIALQGDFINLLKAKDNNGKEIGTIDNLNQMIKDDAWLAKNKDLITISGGRIPIQGLNSLEVAEVWHFLDPAAGNRVVVPSEIVAKAGSDFDVDKIYWMMPSINADGTYVSSSLSNEELNKKIDKIKGKPKKDRTQLSPTSLIKIQKNAIMNQVIKASKDLLLLPENYAALVRPNETYLVQPIAEDLQEYVVEYNRFKNSHNEDFRKHPEKDAKVISPTKTLEVGYNLHKHDVNIVGKDTLGIDALDNKQHPIWNSVGAKMPLKYKDADWDEFNKKYVENDIEYDMRLLLDHNKTKDGNISLSKRYNKAGTRIADLRSHKMNGLLDVEKDAWVAFIQANLETTPVLNYLIDAGVPEKTAIYFVSQGLNREYGKQQRLLKSAYATVVNKQETDPKFINYQAASVIENKIPEKVRIQIYKLAVQNRIDDLLKGYKDKDRIIVETKVDTETTVGSLKKMLADGQVPVTAIKSITDTNGDMFYIRSSSLITNKMFYYSAKAASKLAGIPDNGSFDEDEMLRMIKEPKPGDAMKQAAMFLHFIEIEKQIKGIASVKRQANPDTKVNKTVQQIKKREEIMDDLLNSSKVDSNLLKDLKEKSVLKSFYINDVSLDLVEPLFPLRLNEDISKYIGNALKVYGSQIARKFGTGVDGEVLFTNKFNNGVIGYIFQNYMSNFVDKKGNITDMPEAHRGFEIKEDKSATKGVELKDEKFLINKSVLENQFKNKLYLNDSEHSESYENIGYRPFSVEDDPFPTQSSYNRYVIEREYLRSQYESTDIKESQKDAFEFFLNKRALMNVFNQKAIMGTNEYSYTDQVIDMINQYPELKDEYPILAQLSQAPYKNKQGENIKVLQLNDKALAKGDLAEVYRQNLRRLGDITIRKVKNDVENKRISDVFKVFSLMMLYQHGVGYSKYGFPKVLDETDFVSVMRNASDSFMENHINPATLNRILTKLLSQDTFTNYVVSPFDYNSAETEFYPNEKVDVLFDKLREFTNKFSVTELAELFQKYDNIALLAVPEDVTKGQYEDNAYNVYHELLSIETASNNLKIYIDRLKNAGIDIDTMPDLFYDFDRDQEMSIDDFYNFIAPKIDDAVGKNPPVEEEKIIRQPEVKKDETPLFDPNPPAINIYAGNNENAVLSNFAVRPITFPDGTVFQTVEGAFQAAKMDYTPEGMDRIELSKENQKIYNQLQNATGAKAKELGRKIKDLDTEAWDQVSGKVMYAMIYQSFRQNPDALNALLSTDNAELTHIGGKKDKWTELFPKILMTVRKLLRPEGYTLSNVTSSESSNYDEIEGFYFDLMDREGATGEKISKNLPTLDEAIEEYEQMYASTMTQKQYIDNVLKCKL